MNSGIKNNKLSQYDISVDIIMDINRKRKLSSASNGDDKSEQQNFSDEDGEGISHLQNSDDDDGNAEEDRRTTSDDLDAQRMTYLNLIF